MKSRHILAAIVGSTTIFCWFVSPVSGQNIGKKKGDLWEVFESETVRQTDWRKTGRGYNPGGGWEKIDEGDWESQSDGSADYGYMDTRNDAEAEWKKKELNDGWDIQQTDMRGAEWSGGVDKEELDNPETFRKEHADWEPAKEHFGRVGGTETARKMLKKNFEQKKDSGQITANWARAAVKYEEIYVQFEKKQKKETTYERTHTVVDHPEFENSYVAKIAVLKDQKQTWTTRTVRTKYKTRRIRYREVNTWNDPDQSGSGFGSGKGYYEGSGQYGDPDFNTGGWDGGSGWEGGWKGWR